MLQDTKVNSVSFPYTSSELSEMEIKKIIQFTKASKIIKHLEISLTEEVKVLYAKKTLMKEFEEDTDK